MTRSLNSSHESRVIMSFYRTLQTKIIYSKALARDSKDISWHWLSLFNVYHSFFFNVFLFFFNFFLHHKIITINKN